MASGREAAKRIVQQVRPVLSVNKEEARRRVLNLYKAWYRQIPIIGQSLMHSFLFIFLKRFIIWNGPFHWHISTGTVFATSKWPTCIICYYFEVFIYSTSFPFHTNLLWQFSHFCTCNTQPRVLPFDLKWPEQFIVLFI